MPGTQTLPNDGSSASSRGSSGNDGRVSAVLLHGSTSVDTKCSPVTAIHQSRCGGSWHSFSDYCQSILVKSYSESVTTPNQCL